MSDHLSVFSKENKPVTREQVMETFTKAATVALTEKEIDEIKRILNSSQTMAHGEGCKYIM